MHIEEPLRDLLLLLVVEISMLHCFAMFPTSQVVTCLFPAIGLK